MNTPSDHRLADRFQQTLSGEAAHQMVAGTVAVMAFAAFSIPKFSQQQYLLIHTVEELFAAFTAFAVFAVAWNSRHLHRQGFFTVLGVAFLFVGLFDVIHALVYPGMELVDPRGGDLMAQVWVVARFLEAAAVTVALVVGTRAVPGWVAVAACAGYAVGAGALVKTGAFPQCYDAESGLTDFKLSAEFVVVALKLASATLLWRMRARFSDRMVALVLLYLMATAVSEIMFSAYVTLRDGTHLLGHILKVWGFYALYRTTVATGLIAPFEVLFRDIQRANSSLEAKVEERTRELLDVNRRLRESEQALRFANERLDALIASSPLAIVAFDSERRLTLWNPAAERMFGWPAAEVLGRPSPVAPGALEPSRNELMDMVYRGFPINGVDVVRCRKDGTLIDVRVFSAPLCGGADGANVVGIMTMLADITQEKKAREELQDREERLRMILDNIADAVITIDERGIVESFNPAAERMFGWQASDIVGRNVNVLMPPGIAERHDEYIRSYLSTGRERFLGQGARELEGVRKDGSPCPMELVIDEMMLKGRRVFVGVARDTTERRRSLDEKRCLEHQLMLAHKMEALGHLAGGIAHEFNNMLVPIIGLTDLVLRRSPDDAWYRDDLKRVLEAADRARLIVRKVLTFSRSDAEPAEVHRIDDLLRESHALLRATLSAMIEIECRIEADGVAVVCNPTEFHQIVMNLANNAAHAIGMGHGRITFALDRVRVESDAAAGTPGPGHYARLTVADTGCGMDEATLSRIFDPFFTTKDVGEGTGMGLSVVHGIVAGWGGAITVSSTPGEGTTFRILLPLAAEGRPGAPDG